MRPKSVYVDLPLTHAHMHAQQIQRSLNAKFTEPTNRCEHHRRCEHRCARADPVILPAGGHDYPFQYRLPDKLPSSFESQDVCKGRVHYQLRARIDSPDESIRQNRDRVFLVLSSLDLNKEPRAAVSMLSLGARSHGTMCDCDF